MIVLTWLSLFHHLLQSLKKDFLLYTTTHVTCHRSSCSFSTMQIHSFTFSLPLQCAKLNYCHMCYAVILYPCNTFCVDIFTFFSIAYFHHVVCVCVLSLSSEPVRKSLWGTAFWGTKPALSFITTHCSDLHNLHFCHWYCSFLPIFILFLISRVSHNTHVQAMYG